MFKAAHSTLAGAARGGRSDCSKVKLPLRKFNRGAMCTHRGDEFEGKRIKGSREKCFLSEILKAFQMNLN